MDFLVAGLGFGALLVLAGYAVREFGVFLFAPTRVRKQFAENEELSGAWRRICRFGSMVAMIAGVAIWLLLVVAVVVTVSDKTGAYLLASAATAVSVAGVGAIAFAYRRFFSPAALSKHIDVTAVSSGWNEPEVVADDDSEPVGGWKPRIIPRPTETFVGDMPTWGAAYEEPKAAAPGAETPAAVAQPDSVERLEREESRETVEAAPPPAPEPVAVAIDESAEPVKPEALPAEPETPPAGPETGESQSEAEAAIHVEPEIETGEIEAAASGPVEAIEPESEPIDQVISEAPAPEPAPVAEAAARLAPRRFKSALLSDIDEPSPVDSNAKFKSTILADLSTVRLPDDGPRFRSTALVDVAKPDNGEPESDSENGTPRRRG